MSVKRNLGEKPRFERADPLDYGTRQEKLQGRRSSKQGTRKGYAVDECLTSSSGYATMFLYSSSVFPDVRYPEKLYI